MVLGSFEGHLWFNVHYFSGRPKTLILNDLTVLFDVFALLKALLLGSFLGSFSVPISGLPKIAFWRHWSPPGEPTSARIKSSGALFGTPGAASEKKGVPKWTSF